MDLRILVADDDPAYRELLSDIIEQQGYMPVLAANGKEAIDLFFAGEKIDLCILDVMMPIFDGWEVLEEIRAYSNVPIMMLTALDDERHEIKGLGTGADDYISKPFSYPILVARIEAQLRRVKDEQHEVLSCGRLSADLAARRVFAEGKEVQLNNKEFHLLVYLMRNKGLVLSREVLIERVWGYDFDGDYRTVDTHIKMLRRKLGENCGYISTIRGSGYRFEVV